LLACEREEFVSSSSSSSSRPPSMNYSKPWKPFGCLQQEARMRFSDHVSVSNNSLIFVSLEHCSLEFKLELQAFCSGRESFLVLLPPRLPTLPNPKNVWVLTGRSKNALAV
jgi:hypothetical protein